MPHIEGELRELETWEPKPLVCDNNLLACSREHFDKVIDSLKGIKGVDFNQGLDARLLTLHHLDRLRELDIAVLRFAWDDLASEGVVMSAIRVALAAGFPKDKIRVYVLFGWRDTPADALYRFETLRNKGIIANPQRYQPLVALQKNAYVDSAWTERELARMMRFWARQISDGFRKLDFADYRG